MKTFKNEVHNNPKISLQHSKSICCNILKTHCNTERYEGCTNSKGMGYRCRPLQTWPITFELAGGWRE
jgi:hypothetical protein